MFTFTPQFILDSAVSKLYLTDLWNQFKTMAEAAAVGKVSPSAIAA